MNNNHAIPRTGNVIDKSLRIINFSLVICGIILANTRSILSFLAAYLVYMSLKIIWLKRMSRHKTEILVKTAQFTLFVSTLIFASWYVISDPIQISQKEKISEFLLTCAVALGLGVFPWGYIKADTIESCPRLSALPLAFFEIGIFTNLFIEFYGLHLIGKFSTQILMPFCQISLVLTLTLAYLQYGFARRIGYLTLSLSSIIMSTVIMRIL